MTFLRRFVERMVTCPPGRWRAHESVGPSNQSGLFTKAVIVTASFPRNSQVAIA